jgi:hypothetical protein
MKIETICLDIGLVKNETAFQALPLDAQSFIQNQLGSMYALTCEFSWSVISFIEPYAISLCTAGRPSLDIMFTWLYNVQKRRYELVSHPYSSTQHSPTLQYTTCTRCCNP